MRSTRQRVFALIALAVLALTPGCDEEKEKLPDFKISDWLDVCSPFESLDGVRTLLFVMRNNVVELSEAVGQERAKGVLFAKNPQRTRGTWSADETTKGVVVELGGVTTTYTLVVPAGEGECILASGSINSVDLTKSWFGEPDFSDQGDH